MGLGRNDCLRPREFHIARTSCTPNSFSPCYPLNNDRRRAARSISNTSFLSFLLFLSCLPIFLLLMGSNVYPNPGPISLLCVRAGNVIWRSRTLQCCTCSKWIHLRRKFLSGFNFLCRFHSWSCPPSYISVSTNTLYFFPGPFSIYTFTSTTHRTTPLSMQPLPAHSRTQNSYPPFALSLAFPLVSSHFPLLLALLSNSLFFLPTRTGFCN